MHVQTVRTICIVIRSSRLCECFCVKIMTAVVRMLFGSGSRSLTMRLIEVVRRCLQELRHLWPYAARWMVRKLIFACQNRLSEAQGCSSAEICIYRIASSARYLPQSAAVRSRHMSWPIWPIQITAFTFSANLLVLGTIAAIHPPTKPKVMETTMVWRSAHWCAGNVLRETPSVRQQMINHEPWNLLGNQELMLLLGRKMRWAFGTFLLAFPALQKRTLLPPSSTWACHAATLAITSHAEETVCRVHPFSDDGLLTQNAASADSTIWSFKTIARASLSAANLSDCFVDCVRKMQLVDSRQWIVTCLQLSYATLQQWLFEPLL